MSFRTVLPNRIRPACKTNHLRSRSLIRQTHRLRRQYLAGRVGVFFGYLDTNATRRPHIGRRILRGEFVRHKRRDATAFEDRFEQQRLLQVSAGSDRRHGNSMKPMPDNGHQNALLAGDQRRLR